jgi:ATP-dependent Clp protease, protease subunit
MTPSDPVFTSPRVHNSQQPEQPATSGMNPVFSRLLGERIVLLGSEVKDDNANEICGALLLLAAQSDQDISLYINSPGGVVTGGLAVYDTMPSGGMGGSASDIKIQAEQMILIKRQLAELTAQHTGQSVEQIEADSDRDRWFTADQAQEYGLVDRVMSRSELQAVSGR